MLQAILKSTFRATGSSNRRKRWMRVAGMIASKEKLRRTSCNGNVPVNRTVSARHIQQPSHPCSKPLLAVLFFTAGRGPVPKPPLIASDLTAQVRSTIKTNDTCRHMASAKAGALHLSAREPGASSGSTQGSCSYCSCPTRCAAGLCPQSSYSQRDECLHM